MSTPIDQLERSFGDFPREHQFSTIENLERSQDNPELEVFFAAAEKLVTQWTGDKFTGLYLYGEPGTGKTHAAIGLARVLHDVGAKIHYRHVPSWKPEERISGAYAARQAKFIEPHLTDWMGIDSKLVRTNTPFPTSRFVEGVTGVGSHYVEVHDKSVLILDDYKPFARHYVASAFEAASQYGGLVVVTSNYSDPFKILEETPSEKLLSAQMDVTNEIRPEFSGISKVVREEQVATRDALRSRIAAAVKFIHFEGEDRRMQTSFWND